MGKMTLEAVVTGIEKINALRTSIAALKEDLKGIRDAGQAKNIAKQLEQMKKELKESQSEVSRLKNAMEQMYNSQNVVEGARKITENTNQASSTFIRFSGSTEELKAKLKELNLEYTRLDDAQKLGARGGQLSNEIAMLQAQYDRETQTLRELRREYVNTQKIQDYQEGSINQLRAQILKLNAAYDNLGRSMRNGKPGEEMLASIEKVRVELSAAEQASGRFQRNVGNYASQWNGLSYQMQQVSRELPNFMLDFRTGIVALSNNIPMLGDEIKKARMEYNAYIDAVKSGATNIQKVSPVWKQMLSNIFSWQTALIAAISLTIAYSKEISNWGKELFKGKNYALDLLSVEQELALARKQGVESVRKETTELEILYKTMRNGNSTLKERSSAYNEWIKKAPQYADVMNGEKVNVEKLDAAYKSLKEQIIAASLARAQEERLQKVASVRDNELLKRQNQYVIFLKAQEKYNKLNDEYNRKVNSGESFGTATAKFDAQTRIENAKKIMDGAYKVWDALRANVEVLDKTISSMSDKVDVSNLFPQPEEGTFDYFQQLSEQSQSIIKSIPKDIKEALSKGLDSVNGKKIGDDMVQKYKDAMSNLKKANEGISAYDDLNKGYGKKQETEAEKLRKQQEKYKVLLDKNALDEIRAAEDLQMQVDEARVKAMDEGSKKTIAEMELNFEKELQAIDRQKEDLLRKRISDAREAFESDPKKKKGESFDGSKISLSDDDTKYFDGLYKASVANFDKEREKQRFSDLQMMMDYLKEYGTVQQKKFSIAEEYNEKIAKSTNEWQKKTLAAERDAKITGIETEAIKANIDWAMVFGEFGGMFNDMIKPTLEEAKKYVKTDEFKNSDQASQKTLIDAISQLEKSMSGAGTLNFKKLGEDVKAYQIAERNRNLAIEEEIKAQEKLKKAREDNTKAIKDGTDKEKVAAKVALDNAQANADAASANVKTQTGLTNQAGQGVSDTATKLKNSMDNVAEGLSKLASGGLKGAYDGLIQAGKGMGGAIEKVSDNLENVPIIGWIISIIDILKDGLSNLVGGLLDAIFNAVGGILDDVLSGDLFVTIANSIGNGLMKIGRALGEGLSFGILDLGGADYSRYNEMKDQYDTLNTIWDQLIDKKKEYIGISYGSEANKVGREALELAQKSIDSYRSLGLELLNSGASAGSRSIGKRIRKGMSREGWDQWDSFANSIGMNPDDVGGRMEGLFSLSTEQLEKLKSEAPTFWAKLNDETREYLNSIIEGGERLEEIQEQIKEQLTQVSFDSVFDSFVDTLMDMDSSSKDFANNFEEYMQRAVLTTMVGNKFNSRLQEWYDDFAKANEDKAGITEDEMEALRSRWDGIVSDAVAERDQFKNSFGWGSASSSQSASTKGFQAMSQDTGEELNGRFTALQIASEEIKRLNMEQTMSLKEFAAKMGESVLISSDIRDIAEETRNILTSTYLETVEIRQNTGLSAKYAKEMSEKMDKIERNTQGLRVR